MTWLPFICLGVGLASGLFSPPKVFYRAADTLVNAALVLLMLTIGANIGSNRSLMSSLPRIGFNCVVIILCAMACSVLLTVLLEKTILPLETLKRQVREKSQENGESLPAKTDQDEKASSLIWIMPCSIVAGVLGGRFLLPQGWVFVLGYSLTLSLIVLYTGVGVSLSENRSVFRFVRILGWKVVLPSVSVLLGSLAGGAIAGWFLGLPGNVAVVSAGGMGYYSITGAYLTQACGAEAGTYGFLVNVMRDFFTVLLLPAIVRISQGSLIACGAAGNMDTMLVPVTKSVGPELGLVALITGTILTFLVPFLLPVLYNVVA